MTAFRARAVRHAIRAARALVALLLGLLIGRGVSTAHATSCPPEDPNSWRYNLIENTLVEDLGQQAYVFQRAFAGQTTEGSSWTLVVQRGPEVEPTMLDLERLP